MDGAAVSFANTLPFLVLQRYGYGCQGSLTKFSRKMLCWRYAEDFFQTSSTTPRERDLKAHDAGAKNQEFDDLIIRLVAATDIVPGYANHTSKKEAINGIARASFF